MYSWKGEVMFRENWEEAFPEKTQDETMKIEKFKKRPVVIEAVQITKENVLSVMDWCGGGMIRTLFFDGRKDVYSIEIDTLEGVMKAETGDWIIKGIRGEFYPCKPDIFEETYEAVRGE